MDITTATDDAGGLSSVGEYFFDLQGYLVIEDVLDTEDLDHLNRVIDDQELGEPPRESAKGRFGGFLNWDRAFLNLLDHDRIMPILRDLLGDGFRLDHYYGIHLRKGTGTLNLHGGGTPYDPPEYYHFEDSGMVNGLTVVAWNLCDTGPDQGGFCCLSGSHKANYALPSAIADAHADATEVASLPEQVVVPDGPAGSVTIFTEALTHGTAPWTAEHNRRSLLYKYSPAQQSWSSSYPEPPANADLTDRQRHLFEPPYFSGHPSLFEE